MRLVTRLSSVLDPLGPAVLPELGPACTEGPHQFFGHIAGCLSTGSSRFDGGWLPSRNLDDRLTADPGRSGRSASASATGRLCGVVEEVQTGRFAPSPTGPLHLGNLRTALVSWCAARGPRGTGRWIVRMEDLDPVTSSREHARRQLDHLSRLGMSSDQPVVFQSERFDLYREAIERLRQAGLVYPCYCTRREIREAAAAPHGDGLPDGAYPGTCRDLTAQQRRRFEAEGRRSALRLRTGGERYGFDDLVRGRCEGGVDDVVLQRNDGVPAYNLAVVVDDHLQGVTQVVRGDDLVASTPRQLHLQRLLGFPHPRYGHVPLVIGPDGQRLAKRHGAVTLDDLSDRGLEDVVVLELLARSVGIAGTGGTGGTGEAFDGRSDGARSTAAALADACASQFSFARLPREPRRFDPGVDLPR
jgi:glutamyl-tRNA synthetase